MSWTAVEKYHLDEDVPMCPHCGWKDVEWWDGVEWKHEQERVMECANCEKKFNSVMNPVTFISWELEK